MQHLSKPIRRALALSLVLAVVLGVTTTIVLPAMNEAEALTEQIQETRDLVGHLGAMDAAPQIDRSEWVKRFDEAGRTTFVGGESQAIRIANVQAAAVRILSAGGTKPRSVRNLPPRSRLGFTMVGVQVQASLTLSQLQSLLLQMDKYRPRLLVEELQVTRSGQMAAVGEEGAPLDVRFDVFGIEAQSQIEKARP